MTVTTRATPNIALIKYWGNRNDALRFPAADSLSMTLNSPAVEITVEDAEAFEVESFLPNGSPKHLTEKDTERFEKHFALCEQHVGVLGSVHLTIRSSIPSGVGIASSAAVFAAVAKAYAADTKLTDEQISVLARLGSGSAARSIFGGFVALDAGAGDDVGSAVARQIADENHWKLHDIIIVPSHEEKKVGSTEGHAGAHTSPHFAARVDAIQARRQQECIDAIRKKDFEKLRAISEEDCMDMHRVMETQNPPLHYLSEETHRLIKEIAALRTAEHLPILYTMDAGPTVHLICEEAALSAVKEYSHAQKGCTIFESQIGSGATIIG